MSSSPNQYSTEQNELHEPSLGAFAYSYLKEHAKGTNELLAGNATESESAERFRVEEADMRESLGALSGHTEINAASNDYFDARRDMPSMFREQKGLAEAEQGNSLSWTEWLAQSADSQQLLNFFQWQIYTLNERNRSPGFAAEIQQQKQDYLQGIRELQVSGLLHHNAIPDETALANIEVELKDILEQLSWGGEYGFTDIQSKHIDLIECYEPNHFRHELNHAVLGSMWQDESEHAKYTWIDEAVTEHIAHVIKEGSADVIDPYERGVDSKENSEETYLLKRSTLAAILTKGSHDIPISLVTRYYSAPRGQDKAESKQTLEAAFYDAYGAEDMIERVTEYLATVLQENEDSNDAYQDALMRISRDPKIVL